MYYFFTATLLLQTLEIWVTSQLVDIYFTYSHLNFWPIGLPCPFYTRWPSRAVFLVDSLNTICVYWCPHLIFSIVFLRTLIKFTSIIHLTSSFEGWAKKNVEVSSRFLRKTSAPCEKRAVLFSKSSLSSGHDTAEYVGSTPWCQPYWLDEWSLAMSAMGTA